MAQRDDLGEGLNHGVHGKDGIGGTAGRETDYCPERADAHRHAQRWHKAEDEHTESLRCDNGQETEHEYLEEAAWVWERQMPINVPFVADEEGEKDEELRQEFACESDENVLSGHLHPFVRPPELQLRADGIGGNEEHEEHQRSRNHDGTEVDIVAHPRVSHHVHVESDGLQRVDNLFLCLSEHLKAGRSHGCRSEGGDGLQVFEEHGACHECHVAVEERHFRLALGDEFGCRSFGNIEKGIDFVALYGTARLTDTGVVGHDLCALKGIKVADECACGGGVVVVNNATGEVFWLPLTHE